MKTTSRPARYVVESLPVSISRLVSSGLPPDGYLRVPAGPGPGQHSSSSSTIVSRPVRVLDGPGICTLDAELAWGEEVTLP